MSKKRGKLEKIKGLSIQFIPYSEIRELGSSERIKKILSIILGNNLVILQGKLRADEEARLIEDTMAMIDYLPGFKGVELAVISGNDEETFFTKMKKGVANALVGDTSSVTIIGPATIVKEMKRNPKKIELLLKG